jgi:hypothetical protein
MKKIFVLAACVMFVTASFAQDSTLVPKKKINLANRSNDHMLIQFGYLGLGGSTADSTKTAGFSKSFNVFLMYDFPFKTNPKLSMAFGPGIATDHIVFSAKNIGIKDITTRMRFQDLSDTNHFKKTKLAVAYLEAPIEFRYTSDPTSPGKSFKAAIGVRVGTMINAHTRNSKYEDRNGNNLNDYVMKEMSKRFFNKTRIVAMARVGAGHFTVFGSYQLTTLLKDGAGPELHPFTIGLTLSGL